MTFDLMEPKEIELDGKIFILSKMPAVEGRRVVAVYTKSQHSGSEEYGSNEAAMLEMMKYVAVKNNGKEIRLINRELINSHVRSTNGGNWEMLVTLEKSMVDYNTGFLKPE